jgi:hypothetical protein
VRGTDLEVFACIVDQDVQWQPALVEVISKLPAWSDSNTHCQPA